MGENEVAMRQLHRKIAMKMTTGSTQELCRGLGDGGSEATRSRLKVISVPDLSEDALRRSGVGRGMGVLDLECGAGDTSLRIAKLVGPTGLVVGIDESAELIDVAQRRATVAGQCYWTRFINADFDTFVPDERFDVVVVRLTLLRQGEHVAFLRLSACARLDGVIIVVSGKLTGNAYPILHRIGSLFS
jgi:2-polyprenyl-3-methyl-5-hydroxy-6-metoxy-1,4-benzoquinol methylase